MQADVVMLLLSNLMVEMSELEQQLLHKNWKLQGWYILPLGDLSFQMEQLRQQQLLPQRHLVVQHGHLDLFLPQ